MNGNAIRIAGGLIAIAAGQMMHSWLACIVVATATAISARFWGR